MRKVLVAILSVVTICILFFIINKWVYHIIYSLPSDGYRYTNTHTAEDVYRWFVKSNLIDDTISKKVVQNDPKQPKLIKNISLANGISISEYTYNREMYEQAEAKKRAIMSYIEAPYPAVEFSYQNLSILIPYGVGNAEDFKNVFYAQKAFPTLQRSYESIEAEKSVKHFQQMNSFVSFVDIFNEIDSSDQAIHTYYDYLYNQEATWTGIVIHKEFGTHLALYGKLNAYKGESLSLIRGEFNQNRKPLSTKMPYVFYVSLPNEKSAQNVTKGDIITVKGRVSGYAYRPTNTPSNWSLEDARIVKIQKGDNTLYPLDERDVISWFDRSRLADLLLFKQEKQHDTYITFFRNNTDSIRVNVYSKLQPEKDIHPAHGGHEFTYRNVTVWTSLEKERLNRYQEVLKAEKPLEKFMN